MNKFEPKTPEEVFAFFEAQEELDTLINTTVSDLLGLSCNNPVEDYWIYKTNEGEVFFSITLDTGSGPWADDIHMPAQYLFQDAERNRADWKIREAERKRALKALKEKQDQERKAKQEAEEYAKYQELKAKYEKSNTEQPHSDDYFSHRCKNCAKGQKIASGLYECDFGYGQKYEEEVCRDWRPKEKGD